MRETGLQKRCEITKTKIFVGFFQYLYSLWGVQLIRTHIHESTPCPGDTARALRKGQLLVIVGRIQRYVAEHNITPYCLELIKILLLVAE